MFADRDVTAVALIVRDVVEESDGEELGDSAVPP